MVPDRHGHARPRVVNPAASAQAARIAVGRRAMPSRHVVLALLVMVLWGFNFVAAKWGLEELPPLALTALRFLLVALLLVSFVPRPRGRMGEIAALSVTLGSLH